MLKPIPPALLPGHPPSLAARGAAGKALGAEGDPQAADAVGLSASRVRGSHTNSVAVGGAEWPATQPRSSSASKPPRKPSAAPLVPQCDCGQARGKIMVDVEVVDLLSDEEAAPPPPRRRRHRRTEQQDGDDGEVLIDLTGSQNEWDWAPPAAKKRRHERHTAATAAAVVPAPRPAAGDGTNRGRQLLAGYLAHLDEARQGQHEKRRWHEQRRRQPEVRHDWQQQEVQQPWWNQQQQQQGEGQGQQDHQLEARHGRQAQAAEQPQYEHELLLQRRLGQPDLVQHPEPQPRQQHMRAVRHHGWQLQEQAQTRQAAHRAAAAAAAAGEMEFEEVSSAQAARRVARLAAAPKPAAAAAAATAAAAPAAGVPPSAKSAAAAAAPLPAAAAPGEEGPAVQQPCFICFEDVPAMMHSLGG